MLVLTRKLQEQIRIGNDIVITVLEFRVIRSRSGSMPHNQYVLHAANSSPRLQARQRTPNMI